MVAMLLVLLLPQWSARLAVQGLDGLKLNSSAIASDNTDNIVVTLLPKKHMQFFENHLLPLSL